MASNNNVAMVNDHTDAALSGLMSQIMAALGEQTVNNKLSSANQEATLVDLVNRMTTLEQKIDTLTQLTAGEKKPTVARAKSAATAVGSALAAATMLNNDASSSTANSAAAKSTKPAAKRINDYFKDMYDTLKDVDGLKALINTTLNDEKVKAAVAKNPKSVAHAVWSNCGEELKKAVKKYRDEHPEAGSSSGVSVVDVNDELDSALV